MGLAKLKHFMYFFQLPCKVQVKDSAEDFCNSKESYSYRIDRRRVSEYVEPLSSWFASYGDNIFSCTITLSGEMRVVIMCTWRDSGSSKSTSKIYPVGSSSIFKISFFVEISSLTHRNPPRGMYWEMAYLYKLLMSQYIIWHFSWGGLYPRIFSSLVVTNLWEICDTLLDEQQNIDVIQQLQLHSSYLQSRLLRQDCKTC